MSKHKKPEISPDEVAKLMKEGAVAINWNSPPPKDARKFITLASPKLERPVSGICLHARPVALDMHFLWDCSFPHSEPKELCIGCGPDSKKRWKCYIGLLIGAEGKQVIAEITEQAALGCPALLNAELDLRKYKLTLTRKGVRANSPVSASVVELPERLKVTYPTFDLLEQLSFIWAEGLARKQPKLYAQLIENEKRRKEIQ